MTVKFTDFLDDGREILVIASDFTEDRELGLPLGPEELAAFLPDTDIQVPLSLPELRRLVSKATSLYVDYCYHCWDHFDDFWVAARDLLRYTRM